MKLLIRNTCVTTTILLLNLIVSTVEAKNDILGIKCRVVHFPDPPPPDAMTQGEVWPLPDEVQYTGTRAIGSSKSQPIQIQFDVDHEKCDVLQFARRTYLSKWLFPYGDPENNSAETLVLKVYVRQPCPGPDEFPHEDMDESYVLNVNRNDPSHLEAEEVWGALRGMETFSQMLYLDNNTYVIRTGNIKDRPRFQHRGLLIDTSRHYLSPITIKRQIDVMAMNKLNVLHWHIIDIESFPYVSKKFPNLHEKGAYTMKHLYNPDTIQDIIHYARLRGIRVLPEIDTPGHTGSWKGQPDLLAKCVDDDGKEIPSNILDPTKSKNYKFLQEFLTEIFQVFPDKSIHLGGDEVSMFINQCWENNPEIKEFMKSQGIENITGLETFYFNKLQDIVSNIDSKRRKIFWEEVFNKNEPKNDSIIHVWLGNNEEERGEKLQAITRSGYKAILSSCWYLNYINYGADWKNFYYCDPQAFDGTVEEKTRVVGGEVCMWGEFVDSTNIESRLWPRSSAVAERLWSNKQDTKDADAAWPRLHEFRCRMVARGYRAQPGDGPSFCPVEWNLP